MKICCIKECEKPVLASGMCSMHYRRLHKYGDPSTVQIKQLHGATLEERFLHYTEKSDGCWKWIGSRDPNGYGRLNVNGRPELAHRISWNLFKREPIGDDHALHRCDNPQCVNPDHLFRGDQLSNNADKMKKKRHRFGVSRGVDHGRAELTEDQVRSIRKSTDTHQNIANAFGISRRHVRDIQALKVWRHLT